MKWNEVHDETLVIVIQSADLDSLHHVEITSFSSERRLQACESPHRSVRIEPLFSSDNPPLLHIYKNDLTPLDIATHGRLRIRVHSGERNGSDYAFVHWDEESAHLVCDLLTINLGVTPVWGQSPLRVDPLDIQQRMVPQVKEWVALCGRNGAYAEQAMTYLLIEEFGESLRYVDRGLGLDEAIEGHPQSLTFDDQLQFTRIDDKNTQPRTKFVRLFPPDQLKPVSDENLAARRPHVQWYPVETHPRTTDPVSTARGVDRFYQYMQWVGEHAPGRVIRAMIISHAIVRGPTQLSRNGRQTDFSGRVTHHFLAAFDRNGSMHVTGCNSNSSVVANGDNVLQRQQLAVVEGNIRAAARLRAGLDDLKTYMEYVVNGVNAEQAEADCKRIIGELFDAHPDFAGVQKWRLPGADEGGLIDQRPDYSWSGRRRDGDVIRRQRNMNAHIGRLREFEQRASNTPAQASNAMDEIDWLLERAEWGRVGDLSLYGKDIKDYLQEVRDLLSADVHYMAAMARFAAANGRPDIRAYGGNPGMDGQHLQVTLTVDDGEGRTAVLPTREVTAYTRAKAWSACNRPWFVALYRRFGQFEADVYGYFRYDGKLDNAGRFTGNTGPDTEHGADYRTVHP